MHGQFCYPSVAFLRPQLSVFATDGNFATRAGAFATRGGNFATSAFSSFGHFATFRKIPCGFEKPLLLSAIIDSRQPEVIAEMNSKRKGSIQM